MEGPAYNGTSTLDSSPPTPAVEGSTRIEQVPLQIEGDSGTGRKRSYSILLRGEVEASSILSTAEPGASVMVLEGDVKLLSGSVHAGTAGFVLTGDVVAAEFDEPAPTVKVDGRVVDPGRWPTVSEYLGHGPDQEPVADPFPDGGELGATPDDPLDPSEYTIELDAGGLEETAVYCFDIDGHVVDATDRVRTSDHGDRVYGHLEPDGSASIDVSGFITRIDTAPGIDFSITER